MEYLSDRGKVVLAMIIEHCKECKLPVERLKLEASMLANSFALYEESAQFVNEKGPSMEFQTEKGGVYQQIRPGYTVMTKEYANVLKHAPKFGLNPADFDKIKTSS